MSLSWNEVRDRAVRFARDWKGEGSEKSERQTFWNEFFGMFGFSRRAAMSFEAPVRNLAGNFNRIDGFWRGVVLIERKSRGERLDRAEIQAFGYMQDLQRTGQGDGLAWLKPGTEPSRARTTRSEPRSKCSDMARKHWETRNGSTAQAE